MTHCETSSPDPPTCRNRSWRTKPTKDLPNWIGDEQVQKLILSAYKAALDDDEAARQVLSPLETHPEAGPFFEELLRQIESKDTEVRTRAEVAGGAIQIYSLILGLQRGDPAVREMAREAGRDPAEIEITIYGCPAEAEVVESYREAGVHRLVFGMPSEERDPALSRLDAMADKLMELAQANHHRLVRS